MSDAKPRSLAEAYDALTVRSGIVPLPRRTMLEVRGADRASFLHNLCTNDIKRLTAGTGTEAFFTDASAKILAFVACFAEEEAIVLETVPDQGEFLMRHLDRYIFREDVQLADQSEVWAELLIAGNATPSVLARAAAGTLPARTYEHCTVTIAGTNVKLRNVGWTNSSTFLIQAESQAALEHIANQLMAAGAEPGSAEALEIARVEVGYPIYGRDITRENLPQEIARDATAISFTKGCYIGQETVARIDALGHVNKTLCGVRFSGDEIPPAGTELFHGEKPVGRVTSAVYSLQIQSPLALALVRRGHERPGSKLESPFGTAEIVTLPLRE